MSIHQAARGSSPMFLSQPPGGPRKPHLPFVHRIHPSGRYFVDQTGAPFLIRGDSPWSMLVDLSAAEVDTYLAAKRALGVNALIVGLVGSTGLGGGADSGATYDGVLPFAGGVITSFNAAYWSRADAYLGKIRDAGMTVFLYPMDGWNTDPGRVFDGQSNANCQAYGQLVATRYANWPGIIWMFGGDFDSTGGTVDAQFDACLTGIRAAGDTRPASLQGDPNSTTSGYSYWSPRADFNFCYEYYATYFRTLAGYAASWDTGQGRPSVRPALFMEGEYDNSPIVPSGGSATSIRRQTAWALTSGSPGNFTGQETVWLFDSGWQSLLTSTQAQHVSVVQAALLGLSKWHLLVPDTGSVLVTAGRGTAVTTSGTLNTDNDYVTAAKAPDGTQAMLYLPNAASAITVSWSTMAAANRAATWIDPTSGARVTTGEATSYSRGANAAGASDWLLQLTAG